MTPTEIAYYEWRDIQIEICKELGIKEQYFRNYHEVVGGSYKDLWHEWIDFCGDISNESIVYTWIDEYKVVYYKDNTEDKWKHDFYDAVFQVFKRCGDKHNGLHIKYSY